MHPKGRTYRFITLENATYTVRASGCFLTVLPFTFMNICFLLKGKFPGTQIFNVVVRRIRFFKPTICKCVFMRGILK
jgi:hypothetical protein